jgi:hypothetical protein
MPPSLRLGTITNQLLACKAADDLINARKNTTVIQKSPRMPSHFLIAFLHLQLDIICDRALLNLIVRTIFSDVLSRISHSSNGENPGTFPEEAPQLCRTMRRHTQLRQ